MFDASLDLLQGNTIVMAAGARYKDTLLSDCIAGSATVMLASSQDSLSGHTNSITALWNSRQRYTIVVILPSELPQGHHHSSALLDSLQGIALTWLTPNDTLQGHIISQLSIVGRSWWYATTYRNDTSDLMSVEYHQTLQKDARHYEQYCRSRVEECVAQHDVSTEGNWKLLCVNYAPFYILGSCSLRFQH